jgi:hypothetical protein
VTNQWIKTKLKLDLYLGMAKQCTKYPMKKKSPENSKVPQGAITLLKIGP